MRVIITGATSGIGLACAKSFAAANHDLILIARRAPELAKVKADLVSTGVTIEPLVLDVTIPESIAEATPQLVSADVLINNAGLALGRDPIQKGSLADWVQMIDTNIKGLLYMTRAVLPAMISRGSGHIVNLGSVAGRWTYPDGNVYCATKAAVRALSEAIRLDVHGSGVRVTEIAPGLTETGFSKVRFHGDQAKAAAVYAGTTPLHAADIAESILWCVSRPKHVNIQELVIFPTDQASVSLVKRT